MRKITAISDAQGSNLPEGAQRYLTRAIAVGTPIASAVRRRMHGEIKLKGWYPFSAEEVIIGQNHDPHVRNAVFGKEHVLSAAEANSFSTE